MSARRTPIKACERAEGRFKVIHAAYNAAYDMQQTLFRQWEALGMTMKQLERDPLEARVGLF